MLVADPKLAKAQKLRLLLSQIAVKQQKNLPLTPSEENLLAECSRQRHLQPIETTHVDTDGTIRVVRTNNAEPIMQAMKDYGDVIERSNKKAVAGAQMIGSVDPITAAVWRQECGAGIGTKEFAKYAKKKLADPDYKRFRFGGM